MPGYLSHLAARAFGTKPAVRPRLPSLFEPGPGVSALAAPEGSVMRVVEQERLIPQPPPAVSAAPVTRMDLAPAPLLAPAVPVERQVSTERHVRQLAEPETQKSPAPVLRQRLQPVATRLEAPQSGAHPSAVVRPEVRPLDSGKSAPPPMRERPVPADLLSASEPQRPTTVELPLPLKPRAQSEEPRREPIRAAAQRDPVAAPAVRLLAPLVAPPPESRPAQSTRAFADPAPEETPSVQVTIGRLIVEAVVPAPVIPGAMPALRAPVPRLSLDDYLRQRRSQS